MAKVPKNTAGKKPAKKRRTLRWLIAAGVVMAIGIID